MNKIIKLPLFTLTILFVYFIIPIIAILTSLIRLNPDISHDIWSKLSLKFLRV